MLLRLGGDRITDGWSGWYWGAPLGGFDLTLKLATPAPFIVTPDCVCVNETKPAGPITVHVRDARTGDIEVFSGTSQTRLRDKDLAARIARAIA